MMRTHRFAAWFALSLAACSASTAHGPLTGPVAMSSAAAPLPSAQEIALREQTADQQIRQALDRLTFGARPGDYEHVRAMGVDAWIAMQLDPERIDDRATEAFVSRNFPTLSMSPRDLVAEAPPPAAILAAARREARRGGSGTDTAAPHLSAKDSLALQRARRAARRMIGDLQAAKIVRAEMSERQLQEVMVDFWENHFSIFAGKGSERYFLAAFDRDVIRPHALGKFRDLLGAVATSPAMLFYLDNWESSVEPGRQSLATRAASRARRPAFARRGVLFPVRRPAPPAAPTAAARPRGLNENYGRELLELHTLGVDGGYQQSDVIAAARALTGWSIDRPRNGGGFVFRPVMHDAGEKQFLGHTLRAGRGIEDGEEVLDIVARSPATARFIATKLARRFVSDSPPPALVDRAADTFTRTGGDIRETLRTILTSPEFFSRSAYHAKVKSPFELVVSALRVVNARADDTPRTAQAIARLGQPLYLHRDPNGYPETGDAWINTGAILDRINFGLALARGQLPGVDLAAWGHAGGLDTLSGSARVDAVIRAVLGGEASPDTRKVLESGVNPMVQGTGNGERGTGLRQLIGLALGAPEFQRH